MCPSGGVKGWLHGGEALRQIPQATRDRVVAGSSGVVLGMLGWCGVVEISLCHSPVGKAGMVECGKCLRAWMVTAGVGTGRLFPGGSAG